MPTQLVYKKMPSVWPTCLKIIVLKRKGYKEGYPHISIRAVMDNVSINRRHLESYMEACGLEDDGTIPVLYPHVFTAPLQMQVMSHREFPVSCLGILHYRNHIIQHRRIRADEKFSVAVDLVESRAVKQGVEFDYTIKLHSGDEPVWESLTTYLKKGDYGTENTVSRNSDLIQPITEIDNEIGHYIPAGTGRRYAKISSDFNPIHMSKLLAKIFGYRTTVAHAFWAAGSGIGLLKEIDYNTPLRIDMIFKGPLYTDSRSHIAVNHDTGILRFDYYCGDNPRPSVCVKLSNVPEGTSL